MRPWAWPLFEGDARLPDALGQFGAVRKYDIHTGVDLYTYPGMPVLAVEKGTVVAIEEFTGPNAGSPWWNPTEAILVEGASGVVCYGELAVSSKLQVGSYVAREGFLGCVKTVLRKNKGRPMTMLHLELYRPGTRASVWWKHGEPQPSQLLDPTSYLEESIKAVTWRLA